MLDHRSSLMYLCAGMVIWPLLAGELCAQGRGGHRAPANLGRVSPGSSFQGAVGHPGSLPAASLGHPGMRPGGHPHVATGPVGRPGGLTGVGRPNPMPRPTFGMQPPGAHPSTRPITRPTTRPGTGTGMVTRPSTTRPAYPISRPTRPDFGSRPGRPSTHPGLVSPPNTRPVAPGIRPPSGTQPGITNPRPWPELRPTPLPGRPPGSIRPPEIQPPIQRPPGTRPPGTRPPGTRPPGTRPPGTRPPGTRPPGTRPPGTRPPGTRPPGTRPPGTRPPGTRPPGTRPPGTRPPGTWPPGTRPPIGSWRPPGNWPGTWPGAWPGTWPGHIHHHHPWYHGSWHGWHHGGNWLVWSPGITTGWITGWSYGSRLYDWGYTRYVNPYLMVQPSTTVVVPYDYSRPIDTELPPPAEAAMKPAMAELDRARTLFGQGDYRQALDLANHALEGLPNDPSVHEFRALVLFALGDYAQASQAVYAVLSVGPGWDWTTMISLYGDSEAYTTQLRALESYVRANPGSSSARFLLAYHYLTMGSVDAAARQLRAVVKLKPTDQLSRQMLGLIEQSTKSDTAEPIPSPGQEAPGQAAPEGAEPGPVIERLPGKWRAKPDEETVIELTLGADSRFHWDVKRQGSSRSITGQYTYGGKLLTLAATDGGAMVGHVVVSSPDAFEFRLVGTADADAGLTFTRLP